jgi:hypothetical protein
MHVCCALLLAVLLIDHSMPQTAEHLYVHTAVYCSLLLLLLLLLLLPKLLVTMQDPSTVCMLTATQCAAAKAPPLLHL